MQGHDHSVDLYALGCLIFELLVGVPPFFAANRNVMYMKIMQGKNLADAPVSLLTQ